MGLETAVRTLIDCEAHRTRAAGPWLHRDIDPRRRFTEAPLHQFGASARWVLCLKIRIDEAEGVGIHISRCQLIWSSDGRDVEVVPLHGRGIKGGDAWRNQLGGSALLGTTEESVAIT